MDPTIDILGSLNDQRVQFLKLRNQTSRMTKLHANSPWSADMAEQLSCIEAALAALERSIKSLEASHAQRSDAPPT